MPGTTDHRIEDSSSFESSHHRRSKHRRHLIIACASCFPLNGVAAITCASLKTLQFLSHKSQYSSASLLGPLLTCPLKELYRREQTKHPGTPYGNYSLSGNQVQIVQIAFFGRHLASDSILGHNSPRCQRCTKTTSSGSRRMNLFQTCFGFGWCRSATRLEYCTCTVKTLVHARSPWIILRRRSPLSADHL